MRSEIIIVDNLYDNPFQYYEGFLNNKCIITDETLGKISQIIGNPIEVVSATNESGSLPGTVVHLSCDWIAVIYLTLPMEAFGEFGIKFYSHIATGLETFPTQEEMKSYQIDESQLEQVFSSDSSLWKEYANTPVKYNRMVLFRGNRWHSYENKLNNSMLYQKIIIRNV